MIFKESFPWRQGRLCRLHPRGGGQGSQKQAWRCLRATPVGKDASWSPALSSLSQPHQGGHLSSLCERHRKHHSKWAAKAEGATSCLGTE